MNKQNLLDSFEATVEVCCHRISLWYEVCADMLTTELEGLLTEEGENRAKECLLDDYSSGELNCLFVDGDGQEHEIRGWWQIDHD